MNDDEPDSGEFELPPGRDEDTRAPVRAIATVRTKRESRVRLELGELAARDVLATARVAGLQAAKRAAELVPSRFPIHLATLEIGFELDADGARIHIEASARSRHRSGPETEALVAVSIAAITLLDVLREVDRNAAIERIELLEH